MDIPTAAAASGLTWIVTALAGGVAAAFGLLWWRLRGRLRNLQAATGTADRVETQLPSPHSIAGLVSRDEFQTALAAATGRHEVSGEPVSVLFIDIDGFTLINDAVGHSVGDQLLQRLARRLHRSTPDKLAATCMGGDEFIVLVPGDLARAQRLAQQLLDVIAVPLDLGSDTAPVQVSASIGIAVYPDHGARSRLVAHANAAMRSVKQAGGQAWAAYDARVDAQRRSEAALVAELREAVAKNQLALVYQPKVDARTQRITAAEALLRWHHPVRGVISPGIFIPLAERHGLVGELGDWVIQRACRQAGAWRDQGLRMRVAINLSAYQMRQDDLVPRLEAALRDNRLQPHRFTVEITESLALEHTQATERTFEGLRRAGLHVAIDDFGAGQTSLAYLRRLPASELKMDMSLVRDLATSADARAIAEAVIKLAHALERRVVAEGVETVEQRDWLTAAGCDELQGYLFAKPMTPEALGLWAMDDRPDAPGQPSGAQFSASLFLDTLPQES